MDVYWRCAPSVSMMNQRGECVDKKERHFAPGTDMHRVNTLLLSVWACGGLLIIATNDSGFRLL